jgi:hypothetical protein
MGSGKNLDARLSVEGKFLRYADGRVIISAARIPSLPEPFDFNAKLALSRHMRELRNAGVNATVFDSHAPDSAIGIAGCAGLYAFVEIAVAGGGESAGSREAQAIAHIVRQMRGMRSLTGYLVSLAPTADGRAASDDASGRLLDAVIARLRAADHDRLIAARIANSAAAVPFAADFLAAPLASRTIPEIHDELSRLEAAAGARPIIVELASAGPSMADLAARAVALGAAGVIMPHAAPSDFAAITRCLAPPRGDAPPSGGPAPNLAADRMHDRATAPVVSRGADRSSDSGWRRLIFAIARTASLGVAEAAAQALARVRLRPGRAQVARPIQPATH